MKTLAEIYQRFQGVEGHGFGDKGTCHSYIEVYEELLAPYRQPGKVILEIGIMGGTSLLMWEEYFAEGTVHGADCCVKPHGGVGGDLTDLIATGKHRISIFDASDAAQVEEVFGGVKFDVIIEDANHALSQQLAIYAHFKSHIAPGGLYVIEDVENIERDRMFFESLDPMKKITILDRRAIRPRFDDVLVLIQ